MSAFMPIKTSLKRASGWLYLPSPKGRSQLRGAGVILMLHRVLADDASAALPHRNELCVGPQAFERLLRWLRQHFDCVHLMDLLKDHQQPRGDSRPKVALTFDDGWRDNALNAFPLLQQHQVPASIFLSPDYIGSRQRFWWESLGETLWGSHGEGPRHTLIEAMRKIGRPLPVYCYPNGDHDARVRARLAAHRYPFALSTRAGICQGHDDPLALPRIGVSQRNASRPSLLAWRISRGGRS